MRELDDLPRFAVLEGHAVVAVEADVWADWLEAHTIERQVALDVLEGASGERVVVVTVFWGLDLSFGRSARPRPFETTVHGGRLGGERRCHATWIEAEAAHVALLGEARRALEHPVEELLGAVAPEEGTPRP